MLKKILKVPVKSVAGKLPLINAYNEHCFFVHNGPILSNLKDLLRSLKTMTDAQFEHHVTADKNDFAFWVADVLKDSECAHALKRANTSKKAAAAVERRLKDYAV